MKKTSLIILLIFVTFQLFPVEPKKAARKKNFKFTIYGEYLQPAEERYSDTCGDFIFFPSAKLGMKVIKFFGLYVSYGYLTQKELIEEVDNTASSLQHILSAGGDLSFSVSDSVSIYLSGGVVYFMYSEEALGDSLSQEKLGYRGDLGVMINISKVFYLELSGGYAYATDQVKTINIKLGGISGRLGLGVRF